MNTRFLTLNKNKDFKRLYNKGKSFVAPTLVIYVKKNCLGKTRFGITTSKKIGNAVLRNRARRVIKEAYKAAFKNIKPGFDLVFVARKKTAYTKSYNVLFDMKKLLSCANILEKI